MVLVSLTPGLAPDPDHTSPIGQLVRIFSLMIFFLKFLTWLPLQMTVVSHFWAEIKQIGKQIAKHTETNYITHLTEGGLERRWLLNGWWRLWESWRLHQLYICTHLDFAQHIVFGDMFDGHLQHSNVPFSKFLLHPLHEHIRTCLKCNTYRWKIGFIVSSKYRTTSSCTKTMQLLIFGFKCSCDKKK